MIVTLALLALATGVPGAPDPDPPIDSDGPIELGPPIDSDAPIEIGPPIELGPPIEIGPPVDRRAGLALLGEWTSDLAYDLDDRVRLTSTLALGLDWSARDDLELTLLTRVRHHLDDDADLTLEVRRALLRWQGRCASLTIGVDTPRWGRTLARPSDLLSPLDYREGPVGPDGDDRVPTFALTARGALGDGELSATWLPFFLPAAVGNDEAAPPQDLVASSELALRLTQRLGPLDVGLGWLWRFDRAPPLAATLPVPDREHVVVVDLALTTGPLRWIGEAALHLDHRLYDRDLAPSEHALLAWTFDLQIAPVVFLDVTLGLEGSHALDRAPRAYHEGRDLWLRARASLLLAFDGVVRLDTETRVGLVRDDWWLTPALSVRASEDLVLALGLSWFGGNALDLGLGALYDRADELWLRATYTL